MVAAALLALSGSLLGGSGAEAKVPRGPVGKAFYTPPTALPAGHGAAIWQRRAHHLVPLADAARNRVVLYTSRGQGGARIAVSGVVSVPPGKAPRGGWPVVTWAHGTTGVADACAPSRNRVGSPARAYISYIDAELNRWLRAGYAVVRTDYEGLGTPGAHPYLVGRSEGRSVLDMVRAAREVDRRIGRRYVIAGHSQGGHAALFAAGLASDWVPELRLRGTIAFAPASHLREQGQLLGALTQPSPLSGLAVLIISGAATTSPAVSIPDLLSDEALALYPRVERTCLFQLGAPSAYGGIAPADLLREGADTRALFHRLGRMNPAVVSDRPILIVQGAADTTTIPFFTDQLNDELLELGNSVEYSVYDGVDHGSIVAAADEETLAFLAARIGRKR